MPWDRHCNLNPVLSDSKLWKGKPGSWQEGNITSDILVARLLLNCTVHLVPKHCQHQVRCPKQEQVLLTFIPIQPCPEHLGHGSQALIKAAVSGKLNKAKMSTSNRGLQSLCLQDSKCRSGGHRPLSRRHPPLIFGAHGSLFPKEGACSSYSQHHESLIS